MYSGTEARSPSFAAVSTASCRLRFAFVTPYAPPLAAAGDVQVHSGLAPVRPAWSPQADELAYVIGRPLSAFRPAGFEVWTNPPEVVTVTV